MGGKLNPNDTDNIGKSIKEVYDNGEMDIKTRGVKLFRILELVKSIPDKL